jgi:DNA segregation ATPase FtsK/SpoIIIE-like protein
LEQLAAEEDEQVDEGSSGMEPAPGALPEAAGLDAEIDAQSRGRLHELAGESEDEPEDEFEIAAAIAAAGEDAGAPPDEAPDEATADAAGDEMEAADGGSEEADATTHGVDGEAVVQIPRPPEGIRQQRLFQSRIDEDLIQEAIELVTSTRRVSATFLQRQLRIDFEQAMEVLGSLAHRGVIERNEGETSGRVR